MGSLYPLLHTRSPPLLIYYLPNCSSSACRQLPLCTANPSPITMWAVLMQLEWGVCGSAYGNRTDAGTSSLGEVHHKYIISRSMATIRATATGSKNRQLQGKRKKMTIIWRLLPDVTEWRQRLQQELAKMRLECLSCVCLSRCPGMFFRKTIVLHLWITYFIYTVMLKTRHTLSHIHMSDFTVMIF